LNIVLDTNIFIAAGFRQSNGAARIFDMVHDGKLKFIWNGEIRNEIVGTINKIPGFPGEKFLRLFRKENEFKGKTFPEKYTLVSDPSDRKFIALAKEVKAILITNDDHLLSKRLDLQAKIMSSKEFIIFFSNTNNG